MYPSLCGARAILCTVVHEYRTRVAEECLVAGVHHEDLRDPNRKLSSFVS